MKRKSLMRICFYVAAMFISMGAFAADALIIDHRHTDISRIPDAWMTQVKNTLHIAYQHTSHGSQIVTGMDALRRYPSFGTRYDFDDSGVRAGALDLDDVGIPGCADLSQGDSIDGNGVTPWVTATRNLLNNAANNHVNVIVWSWCSINGHNIPRYLTNMEILIAEYGIGGSNPRAAAHPVTFVFMTGHAEGQGEDGFIHDANQQIRQHCLNNGRVLFDFADIESFNPDGEYFYDRAMQDNLNYTNAAHATVNWGTEWIAGHAGSELVGLTTGTGVAGYTGCTGCAHSDSPTAANINCVLKGRAFWWLLAEIAGWTPDELAAGFAGSGLWVYKSDSATWTQVSSADPGHMIYSGSTLYGGFGGSGIWKFDGAAWSQLTSIHPENMVASGSALYGDFGTSGLWKWNGTAWSQLTTVNPDNMAAFGSTLYGDFGTSGLWKWDGTAWSRLTSVNPDNMVTAGSTLYGVFGTSGLWKWNGVAWSQLASVKPDNLVTAGSALYGDFGTSGLWKWNGVAWSQLTTVNPDNMVTAGSSLYGDFGTSGLWKWNGTAWSQLAEPNPDNMVTAGSSLYTDFGTTGIWKWNGSSWSQLTGTNPAIMAISN